MIKKTKLEYFADLSLLSVALIWGTTFLMIQDVLKAVPVFAFLFWRYGFAAILIAPFGLKKIIKANKKDIINAIILGSIFFLGTAIQTFGLIYTKSSIIAFLTGLSVIMVPFFSFVFFRQVLRKMVVAGSIIAAIGLYMLTMSGDLKIGIGEILGASCAIFFALHIILTDKYSRVSDPYILVLFQLSVLTLASMICSLFVENITFNVDFSFKFMGVILFTALFATVYAALAQTYMQKYTTPTKAAIIFTFEPVVAGFIGYFIGNEILTSAQIFGAVLIIIALLIAEIKINK